VTAAGREPSAAGPAEVGLQGGGVNKLAINRRPLTVIGGLTALGLAATLAATAPSAAGAQALGHQETFTVVADHLNNPRGLSPGLPAGSTSPMRAPAATPPPAFPVARKATSVRGG
jgi:hypothetical protein